MLPFFTQNKGKIINVFKIFYFLLVVVMVVGGSAIYYKNESHLFFYNLGLYSGRATLVVFVITLLPGIARRFNIRTSLTTILMLFRRYLGISVYLLALLHAVLVRLVSRLTGEISASVPYPLFELLGIAALNLLFVMFLTSNDLSVARLGLWWKRIHSLTYVIAWLVFGHVALQNPTSIWSILIGVTAVLEIFSLIKPRPQQSAQ